MKQLLFIPLLFVFFLVATSAEAHRFNVALIAPASGWNSPIGQTIFKRFMVGTTERDGHADEESDGHLGGLDVYVTLADQNQNIITKAGRGLSWTMVDIMVRFTKTPNSKNMATLIVPESTMDAGYKASQIIDKAVRAQAGVDDKQALQQMLDNKNQ